MGSCTANGVGKHTHILIGSLKLLGLHKYFDRSFLSGLAYTLDELSKLLALSLQLRIGE